MKCPECQADGKLVRKSELGFLGDVFRCSCGMCYTRATSILESEERLDRIQNEIAAFEESNRRQEIDMEMEMESEDPQWNGWVGQNGLP